MRAIRRVAACAAVLGMGCVVAVANDTPAEPGGDTTCCEQGGQGRSSLTDNWFGFGRSLEERGIAVRLAVTEVYQINARGGLSTHRRSGRHAGSYDLEITFDLEKLMHLAGASVYALAEGSWSEGVDPASIGSLFGVNGDAVGYRSIDLTQLWYEQALLEGALICRLGKVDLTGGFDCRGCPVAFDGNRYANDETTQFLNGSLVNNPTIPFPDGGLGAAVYVTPVEWWYIAAGVADAQADGRETGFDTAFHGRDDVFAICETGIVAEVPSAPGPLRGAYRVGMWYDPQPKERLDGPGYERNDVGMYLSFDQMLLREAGAGDDEQGLGVFARWGIADDDVNTVKHFLALGTQYQGLIPARDEDVLGLAVARGWLSDAADPRVDRETVFELYYNARLAGWVSLTPDVQYVCNPAGQAGAGDALVVGLRLQMSF